MYPRVTILIVEEGPDFEYGFSMEQFVAYTYDHPGQVMTVTLTNGETIELTGYEATLVHQVLSGARYKTAAYESS